MNFIQQKFRLCMKILVTGSESFVGRELISHCKDHKIQVVGIDSIRPENPEYEFHQKDIRSENISDLIPSDIDALVHLAALSRDQDCAGKAYDCFDINVMGTLNVIKAALKKNVKQFIFASSEWVYNDFGLDEEKDEDSLIDIAKHTSEYALSKLVSESNLREQFNRESNSITILRFGIIYGPRKNNWSAVESISNKVKNNDEVSVGSLKTGRRFIHVSDIANGIIKSIGLDGFNIINLTADDVITLNDIIHETEMICNKKIKIIQTDSSGISIRNPSNNKAKEMLNWKPEINLREGLKSIFDFI